MADYDYSLVGSFSTGAASSLNGDLINKLRAAEEKAVIAPIDKSLETWDKELEVISDIDTKINTLRDAIKPFDLFNSNGTIFEAVSASTTGTSAVFDAVDVSGLTTGTTTIDVTQLAQRDVYQSNIFSDSTAIMSEGQNDGDKLSIQIGTNSAIDFTTKDKTYQELADEINATDGLTASVEQVGTNEYRLVIKSTESGVDNALTITQTDSSGNALDPNLGYGDSANHTLNAQNLQAKIDGVDYDVASNTVTIQGNLTMTAVELGSSSITIQKDTSGIIPALDKFVAAYNDVVDSINNELYSDDSSINDPSSIRSMLSQIKDKFFGTYGDDDKSAFNYGLNFDKDGHLSIDSEKLGEAITDDLDGLKDMFLGSAEDKGLGTQLKELLDDMNAFDGSLTAYEESMNDRKTKLEKEREKAMETLDAKYSLMVSQFSAYGAIIAQMESSFSGLKLTIDQSTASK
jgi:flagellar hook-associated protein 2